MGLGKAAKAGKAALGSGAAAHPLAKLFEETLLQIVEGNVLGYVLFRTEIGHK